MNVCLECNYIFEHHKQWKGEHLEHFGMPCREDWFGCPKCSSCATVKIFKCDSCGEDILNSYIKIGDKRICDNCFETKELGDEK